MEDRNKDTANKINTTSAETPPMEAATATTTTSASPIKTNPFLTSGQFTETYDTTTKTTAKEITTATNEEKTYSSDSTIPSEELEPTNYAKTAVAAAADAKDDAANLSQNRMNQILQAHSEQTTTTTACVEVQTANAAASLTATAEMNMATTGTTCAKNVATSLNVVTLADARSAIAADIGTAAACASEKSDNISEGTVVASNDTADTVVSAPATGDLDTDQPTPTASIRSIGSFVCRICHNAENPERLVSPCLCKGSLTYVHIHCLERWISTSRNTTCELCQFQYNTEQTLRYTCLQSLRMWYSRSMSRRALQEDCQMFSLLTLVAFGIIGTLLVGIQYYFLQGNTWGLGRLWTKGWMVFFLFTTLVVYFVNIYMIVRSQLAPWYRWWRSARDIKLILENRKPFHFRPSRRLQTPPITEATSSTSDASELPMMMPPTLQPNQQQQQQLQQHHQLLQQHHQQEQQSTATAYPPTPSAAAAATTTTTLLPKTLTLQLQLNNKAATAAAIAALDAVVYNKYAKNYNNNMKKCHTLRSLTAATAAAAGDTNLAASDADVANAAIEIPLDPVVYELASAL